MTFFFLAAFIARVTVYVHVFFFFFTNFHPLPVTAAGEKKTIPRLLAKYSLCTYHYNSGDAGSVSIRATDCRP